MTTPAPAGGRVRHLVVGPDEHGVVRHGVLIADACHDELLRVADVAQAAAVDHRGTDVVHIPFTDRLFGDTCESALAAFEQLARQVVDCGAAVSVTLHDVPHGPGPLAVRRRTAYRGVVELARGVVVNSRVELAVVEDDADNVHSLRCIPLPVDRVPLPARPPTPPADRDVVVLGFVFPDRGYEQVIAALPAGSGIRALGRASAGHEDLPARLAALAAQHGHGWQLTGFVPDGQLSERLWAAAVPVAPNPRVSASASIATWLAHGRRPLVPAVDYTRELAALWPGGLRLYEADDVDDLAAAIAQALDDPASTWLDDDVCVGPSLAEVAAGYRTHLDACRTPRASVLAGRVVVPHNRWDLLPASSRTEAKTATETEADEKPCTVTVVIPYYEAQRSLDLVLTALTVQTHPRELFEVVIADDGSAHTPDLSAAEGLSVSVVRQTHDGFGAARARNLGARAGSGEVFVFLDADTVPEPAFLEHLIRIPKQHVDGLTVGRRRHADFAGWGPAELTDWFAGTARGPVELPEPAWLRSGYCESADLLHADPRSYRYVISAVLAVHRSLFERLGGFDERFRSYGGEDWEFAHRAWLAAALIAHVPPAVAWHDGPSWGERVGDDRKSIKNAETLALTALLPDPLLRGGGQWFPYCRIVVQMHDMSAAEVLATARTAFASGADCGIWCTGAAAQTVVATLADPRISLGTPPPDVLVRAAVTVDVADAADLTDLARLSELTERLGIVTTPAMTLRSTRARSGCRDAPNSDEAIGAVFGRHDRSRPVPEPDLDLGRLLARTVSS